MKKFQDKISINAFSILPVADSNQITAHLLDVLYTHLRFTKGALDVSRNPIPSNCTRIQLTRIWRYRSKVTQSVPLGSPCTTVAAVELLVGRSILATVRPWVVTCTTDRRVRQVVVLEELLCRTPCLT